MDSKIVKVIAKGVTFQGADVTVGETLELGAASADSLVAEGFAEFIDESSEPAGGNQDDEAAQAAAAELERIKKALDDQYKAPELKDAAKDAGVEFAYDATKPEVIQAVIDQDKAAALLK